MAEVISGYQLYKGKKLKDTGGYSMSYFQPLQFLPAKDKNLSWATQMINYVDWQSQIQLRDTANWMLKNYKLAIGEIEKSDYIKMDNEYADMIGALEKQAGGTLESMELKNYPFASTVINILTDEFAKRVSHMSFDDKSDLGVNEMLDAKREEIEKALEARAAINQMMKLQQLGLSEDSKEGQQMMDPNTIKSLPEIQKYFNKSYRNIYQEWAEHQMQVDNERFSMPELERENFRNMLITDREFFHFKMMDNDYLVETWNPPQVAYRKSPSTRYISDASWVCHIDYLTVPDAIDREGWKMSEEQLLSLNTLHGARAASYALDAKDPEGYYRGDQSYEWNRTGPGLGMRQALSVLDGAVGFGGDITKSILNEGQDVININGEFLVRVSTVYWKSQRKLFHLTKVDENGNFVQDIVGEDYKVTDKPMYNTVLYKEKTKENLVFGEHLDPLWVNESYGAIRIGTNAPSMGWQGTSASFAPIYLGVNGPTPGRLKFQFKGDNNLYGCKLPVEGRIFNDHNTKSRAMMDNLKPWQIGYNMTNNLIQDTMINDYGVILAVDPNAIPKHSTNDDWGTDPMASTVAVIKTGGVLPFSTVRGTDGQLIGHDPLRRLDLSQTERLLGLMKISDWFKMSGLDSVGMNPQRLGTPIGQEQTATEVNEAKSSSYSHTEYLFSQHCDELMPRVHQMRTDLAQFYNSTNPSLRLQYMTGEDEKAFFQIDGTKLMGRDFNVKCKTTVNSRYIMQQVQQMLRTDSSGTADLFDKVKAIQIPVMSELNNFMTSIQKKLQDQETQKQQGEQQAQEAEQQHQMQLLQEKQQFEASENEKDREAKKYETELMAAARAASSNPPQAGEDAYQEATKLQQQQQAHTDKMDLDKQKFIVDAKQKEVDQQLTKQKLNSEDKRTQEMAKASHISNNLKAKKPVTKK